MERQTVRELIEDLQKLPQDDLIDIGFAHTFQFRHFPKKEKTENLADETVMAEQGD